MEKARKAHGMLAEGEIWRWSTALLVVALWAAMVLVGWLALRRGPVRRQGPGIDLRATMPAAHARLEPDGRLRPSDEFLSLLRIDPARKADLFEVLAHQAVGFASEDIAASVGDVEQLVRSGFAFSRILRNPDHQPLLLLTGRPLEAGSVLWLVSLAGAEVADASPWPSIRGLPSATLGDLFDAAPFPVWRRDQQLRLTHVNAAYAQAVDAQTPLEVIERELKLAPTRPGQPDGAACEEVVIVNGQRRFMQILEQPLPSGGHGGFALDVTEVRSIRAELARQGSSNSALLDRLSAGFACFSGEGTLDSFNATFATMFRLDEDWLHERPDFNRVLERMREAGRLPEQRDFASWRDQHRRWLTGADLSQEVWALPDTSIIRVIAQTPPSGEGLILVFEDRTAQLRMGSRMDTLRRVQQAVVDRLDEGVAVFGADGRLRLWNQRFAHVCALPPQTLSGEPHVEALMEQIALVLQEPERIYNLRQVLNAATTGREARRGQLRGSGPEGRIVQYTASPLPDGNALIVLLDVTERQRLAELRAEGGVSSGLDPSPAPSPLGPQVPDA